MLSIASIAYGQFNIKIPKVKKPKVKKPKTEVSGNTKTSVTDMNFKSREMVVDDAFTYFEAVALPKPHPTESRKVDDGWALKSYLRVMGTFPKRSAFKISVLKDGKVLATNRCQGGRYVYDANARPKRFPLGDNFLWHDTGCWSKKAKIDQTGNFDVEIRVVNGDTDEETLVRTYKIDVEKITRVRGPVSNTYAAESQYAIMRHTDTAVAFIHYRPPGTYDYYNQTKNQRESYQRSMVQIYYSMSLEKSGYYPRPGYVRCTVDGNRVKFPDNGSSTDAMSVQILRTTALEYTDRIAPKFKRGAMYKDPLRFSQITSVLPMTWAGDGKKYDRLEMSAKPGNWECKYINNGEVYRIFRFKVEIDGAIAPHPEQASGNVNLYRNAFMIDMEIPEGGTEFDYRLGSQPEKGFFYGIPWKTAEGKAMAKRVPTKGSLLPTPSNKIK